MLQPLSRSPSKFSIKPISFDDDPPHASEFYEALGKIVCLWGRLENQIALGIVSLQQFPEAATIDGKLQRAWKKKVELWEELFTNVPIFSPAKVGAIALIRRADYFSQDRHLLQHSHFYGFENDAPLTANFRSVERRGKYIALFQGPVSLPELNRLLAEIEQILELLYPVMTWISDLQQAHPVLSKSQQSRRGRPA